MIMHKSVPCYTIQLLLGYAYFRYPALILLPKPISARCYTRPVLCRMTANLRYVEIFL